MRSSAGLIAGRFIDFKGTGCAQVHADALGHGKPVACITGKAIGCGQHFVREIIGQLQVVGELVANLLFSAPPIRAGLQTHGRQVVHGELGSDVELGAFFQGIRVDDFTIVVDQDFLALISSDPGSSHAGRENHRRHRWPPQRSEISSGAGQAWAAG